MTHPYASSAYAEALSYLGSAVPVPEWGGFVVARPIAAAGRDDATGPYPRTPIAADADLQAGLARLAAQGLVSVTLVPDPLAAPPAGRLAAAFEICRPFKTHLLIDRSKPFEPSKHHRDRIRRGLRRCRIEVVSLADRLDDWRGLYAELAARHGIAGAAAFPDPYFPTLARTPAFVAFVAYVEGRVAGMTLWFEHAGVAVSHLTAANALGYANGANYALNAAAMDHFGGAAVVDLGGGAGVADDPNDGLFRFKQGFANARAVAHLCGAVLDRPAYDTASAGRPSGGFFPAYRG